MTRHGRRIGVTCAALAVATLAAGCGASGRDGGQGTTSSSSLPSPSPASRHPAPTSTSTSTSTSSPSPALAPPLVPPGSSYLGAWVNPNQLAAGPLRADAGAQELAQLPAFTASIGRQVAVLHVYTGFAAPVPLTTLHAVSAAGAVPLLDWGCADVTKIADGSYDELVRQYASTLKSYAGPVFLRWYWEFNQYGPHARRCGGLADPSSFVAAWQRLWTIFHSVGASNVAFVWCPGLAGRDPSSYYPGDQYVDWIGIDGYDRSYKKAGTADFGGIFGPFYAEWVGHGKPLMVAETGAVAAQQAQYLGSIQKDAPTMPQLKAVLYFDAAGPSADWALTGSGIDAFRSLAIDPYFTVEHLGT